MALDITAPFVTSSTVVYTPTITVNEVTISPATLASPRIVHEWQVFRPDPYAIIHTGGRLLMYPGYVDWMTDPNGRLSVDASSTDNAKPTETGRLLIYSPLIITAIDIPRLPSGGIIYTPSVSPGEVSISPGFIKSSAKTYIPSLQLLEIIVSPSFVPSTSTIYTVSLDNLKSLQAQSAVAERNLLRSTIAGFFGPAQMRTNIFVSDIYGNKLGTLTGVHGASINMNNFRDTTWELSITLDRNPDFNPFSDWLGVEIDVWVKDKWISYPMGLYKFETIGGEHLYSRSTWDLTGYSGEIIFADDQIRNVTKVPKNAFILKTVRDGLIAGGVPPERISFPMGEDKQVGSDQIFDPFNEEEASLRIRMWNTLLNIGGFHAIYVSKNGQFTTESYKDVRGQDPAVHYGIDGEKIVLSGVSDNWDNESFANAIVVVSEDPKQVPPIVEAAENRDPNSLASRQNYGKWKVKTIKRKTIPDKATAQKIAKAQLQASSGFWRTIGWSTPPDPERGPKEYYSFNQPRPDTDDVVGIFRGGNFGFEVYPHPKEMSFEGSKTEEV